MNSYERTRALADRSAPQAADVVREADEEEEEDERVSVVGIALVLLLFFIGLSNDIGRFGS